MAHIDRPFARIVVGYDASAAAETALRQAVALADQYGGEIIAVHVTDFSAATVLPVPTKARATVVDFGPLRRSLTPSIDALFEMLSDCVADATVPVTLELVMNRQAAGILDAATRWRATAIAVGTHARTGLSRALIGSVADEVLRSADVPVIVTRDGTDRRSLRRVVVGIDASEPSTSAGAFGVALGFEQPIRMVYCTVSDTTSLIEPYVDLPFDPTPVLSQMRCSARNALDAALITANDLGVYPDTDIIDASDVGAGLCAAASRHDSDAIVVGSHKRGELERFFIGSTAKAVILGAERPVIVVPAHAKFASAKALVGGAV